jgi:hypothetical protein
MMMAGFGMMGLPAPSQQDFDGRPFRLSRYPDYLKAVGHGAGGFLLPAR